MVEEEEEGEEEVDYPAATEEGVEAEEVELGEQERDDPKGAGMLRFPLTEMGKG